MENISVALLAVSLAILASGWNLVVSKSTKASIDVFIISVAETAPKHKIINNHSYAEILK